MATKGKPKRPPSLRDNEIRVKDVVVGERLRSQVNLANVRELADSIQKIGLLHPIVIDNKEDGNLIAGYHRLEATKMLGWKFIAFSEAPEIASNDLEKRVLFKQLQEIDENVIRYELHYIDRSNQLKNRKEIHEQLYSETKHGAHLETRPRDKKGRITKDPESGSLAKSFVEDTSKKTGFSKSKIAEEVQIAENVIPEAQAILKEQDRPKTEALQLARMPAERQAKVVQKIKQEPKKKVRQVIREVAREERAEQLRDRPPLPNGEYDVIYADPPWRYEFTEADNREVENHYPTMDLQEICDLEVPAAQDAVLFLWVTSPKLEEGLKVLNAWGFTYRTSRAWVKDKIGMGYYARSRHEFLLIGVKGAPGTPAPKDRPDSVIEAPRQEHSQKPEVVYSQIEQMYPSRRYLEMFARNQRENWTAWGNET